LKRRYVVGSVLAIMLVALFALAALATDAEMYFASDSNGANRVTNIQEGDEIWIVIYDPDKNDDCDIRDKFTADVKIMDPKTGAYIIWNKVSSFNEASPTGDHFEETEADSGLFVSHRPFQVGTREAFTVGSIPDAYKLFTHVVDNGSTLDDFQWGHYLYTDIADGEGDADERGWLDEDHSTWHGGVMTGTWADGLLGTGVLPHTTNTQATYTVGRFENMDTLVGMYQDPKDLTDVAIALMKIIDTEAVISWDKEVYKDANTAATITVVDPDENLNCDQIEYVPVFILVNPGSWVQTGSAVINNFCELKRQGGYTSVPADKPAIRWYNIYEDRYIYYPVLGTDALTTYKTLFDVENSLTPVVFFAKETEKSSGVFELKLNSILTELKFKSLNVRDVLVAYYLDPNDFDDFKLATSYIEERQHSLTSFTDASRMDKSLYWIGRDPVYVQVIDQNANVDPCCPEQVVVHICDPHGEDDSEWVVLDETSSNSPVFFTNAGTQLWPVWDALGVGLTTGIGGYQLQLDNWKLEVFNEDDVYARYNDVYYTQTSMNALGNQVYAVPVIDRVRVFNDVSFDLMSISDTQVYNGQSTNMYFLDRQGNRVSGYVNSDCVFVEVIDLDQDEDQYRRERINGYWDGGQNVPFGPQALNEFKCDTTFPWRHGVNKLLGDTNIFNDSPLTSLTGWGIDKIQTSSSTTDKEDVGWAKLYVLNPRSGRWAALDLLETGVATGDFISVICIDLVSVYSECVPTLEVLPGDTIVAVYQDPSNHSDSAWISIKVGIGGGGVPPGQASSTDFVDAQGNTVTTYTDADDAYVKVIDPSHAGADTLTGLEVEGIAYDLSYLEGANTDTFITEAIPMVDLGAVAGDEITANYTDATDPLDTSTDTVPIISSELVFESFIAKPNPFSDEVTFTFEGAGIPETFAVTVYNMSGHLVWSEELANATEIVWDGTNEAGMPLANGPYIYVAMITDGTDTYTGKGKVFINK